MTRTGMVQHRTHAHESRRGRTTSRRLGTGLGIVLGVAFALAGADANASGFATARFGGEHGHPTTDNPTAIYYNPAGIALSKGTHIFIDGTMALRWASYSRPGVAPGVVDSQDTLRLAPGANDGKATLFNFVGAPFLGLSSDFGTDFIYGGVSFSVPFGGQATWDQNERFANDPNFPGAVDGQQRWYTIVGSMRSMYLTGALAFNIRQIGLSIGISGSAIRSSVDTIRARNADGTDDLVSVRGDELLLKEGRSRIDVAGWQGGFGIGLVYDVAKLGKYFLGASYTSQPNVAGGMSLEGELTNVLATGLPSVTAVELQQTLPDIFRFGIRVRPTDKYELRLFGDFTRWAVFDKQCILELDEPNRNCDFRIYDGTEEGGDPGRGRNAAALDDPSSFGGSGHPDDPNRPGDTRGVTQHLPRFWKNAGGIRAGASYWFIPAVEGYLGVGYDSTAVPLETLDPALMDAHKMSTAMGVRWQIIKNLAMSLTSTQIIFFRTSTQGESALSLFQSPTRQPSGNGVYRQFLQVFNIYADISF
jgi:long-chain fatty acid transport protein